MRCLSSVDALSHSSSLSLLLPSLEFSNTKVYDPLNLTIHAQPSTLVRSEAARDRTLLQVLESYPARGKLTLHAFTLPRACTPPSTPSSLDRSEAARGRTLHTSQPPHAFTLPRPCTPPSPSSHPPAPQAVRRDEGLGGVNEPKLALHAFTLPRPCTPPSPSSVHERSRLPALERARALTPPSPSAHSPSGREALVRVGRPPVGGWEA